MNISAQGVLVALFAILAVVVGLVTGLIVVWVIGLVALGGYVVLDAYT